MKVTVFCIAKMVDDMGGNGLTLIDAVTGFAVKKLPTSIPMRLAIRLRGEPDDGVRPHRLELKLFMPNGELAAGGTIDLPMVKTDRRLYYSLAQDLPLRITEYGDYKLILEINGVETADEYLAITNGDEVA